MSQKVTVRIEKELINKVRQHHPELKDVSDSDIVRIVFRKLLGE
ncbi:MAG: hypothetical protein QXO00_02590 [Candidatus Bathyarchaeia archaeon]